MFLANAGDVGHAKTRLAEADNVFGMDDNTCRRDVLHGIGGSIIEIVSVSVSI
jgi:hypothetical protein